MRFHTQTAGVSLTAQQPLNNIARVALQGLAAVLGGTQSLHTDSYDEALALPTAEAARIALRTQQVIAYESGVANTIDPLAGSYFVERLTLDMENGAFAYFDKLDAMGGMVKAIERGFPQKEIAEASYQFQKATEAREKITVGANEFVIEEEPPAILYIGEGVGERQKAKLQALRARRDNRGGAAGAGGSEARGGDDAGRGTRRKISEANTMPYILEAVRAYATVGEICEALREVYGSYTRSVDSCHGVQGSEAGSCVRVQSWTRAVCDIATMRGRMRASISYVFFGGLDALIWQTKAKFAYWWRNLVWMDTTGAPR